MCLCLNSSKKITSIKVGTYKVTPYLHTKYWFRGFFSLFKLSVPCKLQDNLWENLGMGKWVGHWLLLNPCQSEASGPSVLLVLTFHLTAHLQNSNISPRVILTESVKRAFSGSILIFVTTSSFEVNAHVALNNNCFTTTVEILFHLSWH